MRQSSELLPSFHQEEEEKEAKEEKTEGTNSSRQRA